MENQRDQQLIQRLLNCAQSCEDCATSCLGEEHVGMMAKCISLDRDCSDICFQAARLLMRDSPFAARLLIVCEEICRACADECSKHEHDHCQRCAESCSACAEACQQYHSGITED